MHPDRGTMSRIPSDLQNWESSPGDRASFCMIWARKYNSYFYQADTEYGPIFGVIQTRNLLPQVALECGV
jgi:hypothetical protein